MAELTAGPGQPPTEDYCNLCTSDEGEEGGEYFAGGLVPATPDGPPPTVLSSPNNSTIVSPSGNESSFAVGVHVCTTKGQDGTVTEVIDGGRSYRVVNKRGDEMHFTARGLLALSDYLVKHNFTEAEFSSPRWSASGRVQARDRSERAIARVQRMSVSPSPPQPTLSSPSQPSPLRLVLTTEPAVSVPDDSVPGSVEHELTTNVPAPDSVAGSVHKPEPDSVHKPEPDSDSVHDLVPDSMHEPQTGVPESDSAPGSVHEPSTHVHEPEPDRQVPRRRSSGGPAALAGNRLRLPWRVRAAPWSAYAAIEKARFRRACGKVWKSSASAKRPRRPRTGSAGTRRAAD